MSSKQLIRSESLVSSASFSRFPSFFITAMMLSVIPRVSRGIFWLCSVSSLCSMSLAASMSLVMFAAHARLNVLYWTGAKTCKLRNLAAPSLIPSSRISASLSACWSSDGMTFWALAAATRRSSIASLVFCIVACVAFPPTYNTAVSQSGLFSFGQQAFALSGSGNVSVVDTGTGNVYTYDSSHASFPSPVFSTVNASWTTPYALTYDGSTLIHGNGVWLSVSTLSTASWVSAYDLPFPVGLPFNSTSSVVGISRIAVSAGSPVFVVSVSRYNASAQGAPPTTGWLIAYVMWPGSSVYSFWGVVSDGILNVALKSVPTGNYSLSAALSDDGHVLAVGQLAPSTRVPCVTVLSDGHDGTGASAIAVVPGPFPSVLGTVCFAVASNTGNLDYVLRLSLDAMGTHGALLAYVDPRYGVIPSSNFMTFAYGTNPSTGQIGYYRDSDRATGISVSIWTDFVMSSDATFFILSGNQVASLMTFLSRASPSSVAYTLATVSSVVGELSMSGSREGDVISLTQVPTTGAQTLTNFLLLGQPRACVYSSSFTSFGACSVTCGGGMQSATPILMFPAAYGGSCSVPPSLNRSCNTAPCPVACVLSDWSLFSPCSAPCEQIGTQCRTKTVLVNASAGGQPCGPTSECVVCKTVIGCSSGPTPTLAPAPAPVPSPSPFIMATQGAVFQLPPVLIRPLSVNPIPQFGQYAEIASTAALVLCAIGLSAIWLQKYRKVA